MIKIKPNRNFYLLMAVCFCVGFLTGIYQISPTGSSNFANGGNVAEQVKKPSVAKFECPNSILIEKHYREIVALASEKSADGQNQQDNTDNNKYLGSFRVTRYDGCEQCCGEWAKNRPMDENGKTIVTGASGRRLTSGVSCAADRSIPFGTKLYIPQVNMVATVEDRAAKWIEERYDGKFIDLYFDEHAHYIDGATDYMDVYVIE